MIKTIRVAYTLVVDGLDADKRASIERAHELHAPKCPVYKTLEDSVDMTTSLSIVEG